MKQYRLFNIRKITLAFMLLAGMSSCDYLDVIPDNLPTIEHSFRDRAGAEKFLFTCYNRLPQPMQPWLDPAMIGGDELYSYQGSDQMTRDLIGLATGRQTVNNPLHNCWDGDKDRSVKPLYEGIRDCNTFLENIINVYDVELEEKVRWSAEVKFLKAYYHFYLLRMYGAIPIVDKNLPISSTIDEMNIYREPFDDCVKYISDLLDEAIKYLPLNTQKPATEAGRITQPIALAIKAKLLMTAASPLFNGNPDYAGIIDNKGRALFNTTYDATKWEKAAAACKAAIDTAELAGHTLYHLPTDPMPLNDEYRQQLELRMIIFDAWNKETIWGATNGDAYWLGRLSLPKLESSWDENWNVRSMLAPTMDLVETFYTKNGVPIDEDTDFDYENRYERRYATEAEKWYIREGEETAKLHFDREPRFYAAIGFDRGMWFGNGRTDIYKYDNLYYTPCRSGESCGIKERFYSATGYYSKKLTDYRTIADKSNYTFENVPIPAIRLADLYLLYAEALNEVQGAPDANVYYYINEVRKRAGLDGVVESWAAHSKYSDKPTTKTGMRDIIQHERMVELAMEGQRFWDIRRWKLATDYFNRPLRGWNIKGQTADEFYNLVLIEKRSFSKKDYLWPIKEDKVINNPNLTQNYGW